MRICLVILAAVAAAVAATHDYTSRVLIEPEIALSSSWTLKGPAAANEETSVFFFLKHLDDSGKQLEMVLNSVSDPRSPSYGKHLSNDDLKALLLSKKNVDTLTAWLSAEGVSDENISVTLVGDLVKVKLTTTQAERLFATKLSRYTRQFGNRLQSVLRATTHTVPAEIAAAISVLSPWSVTSCISLQRLVRPSGLKHPQT